MLGLKSKKQDKLPVHQYYSIINRQQTIGHGHFSIPVLFLVVISL